MFSALRFGMSLSLLSLVSLQPVYGAGMEAQEPQKHSHQEEMHTFSFKDSKGITHEGLYYLKEVPCPVGFNPQKGSEGHPVGHPDHKPDIHHATIHEPQQPQHATTTKPQQATVEELPKPQQATISPALPEIPEQVNVEGAASRQDTSNRRQELLETAGKLGKAMKDMSESLPETKLPS